MDSGDRFAWNEERFLHSRSFVTRMFCVLPKKDAMATNTPRLPGENDKAERRQTPKDARGVFTELAIRSGLMTDAGELSEEMYKFGMLIAQHCAEIADNSDGDSAVGNDIRVALLDSNVEQANK